MTNQKDVEEQLIETIDEDGNVINFELIDIVQVEDDDSIKDNEYALLLPVDENGEESDEEKEVVLMKLIKDGEEYLFEAIEDDEEFDKVVEYINLLQSNDNDEE